MYQRKFALFGGIAMLIIGFLALLPALSGSTEDLPSLTVNASYGLFLNNFPMNIFDKLILIFLGLAGIAVSSKEHTIIPAIKFARAMFWLMSVLTILGLFNKTNTLYGYWPLYGSIIWLHLVFAMLAGYFGYNSSARAALVKNVINNDNK